MNSGSRSTISGARILVADVPAGISTIRNVIKDGATVIGAETIDSAVLALHQGVDAILCGIHLEESRMFDLLRVVKADPRFRAVPFKCFRDLESELPPTFLESLDISCKALGAIGFIDMYRLKQQVGIHRADEEFARIILSHTPHGERSL